jgi:uncharacterized protein
MGVGRTAALGLWLLALPYAAMAQQSGVATGVSVATPLVIGETFTLQSNAVGEVRRINVWRPPLWAAPDSVPLPVLYMPDGGVAEDFQHVAGLLQVLIGNGGMRPFLLVGIENTQRRRDLTGPTTVEADTRIAPVVGKSAAFRRFLRDELKPHIARRYRVTTESAIVGESLAGLFVLETLLLEPTLFTHYLAFDPSLWWNGEALVKQAPARLGAVTASQTVYVALSSEPTMQAPAERFEQALKVASAPAFRWYMVRMPEETHATIYHPAALRAFRTIFRPQ